MAQITALENGKLAAVKEFGAEHGWAHGAIKRHPEDDAVTLTLRRQKEKGGEFIEIRWDSNAIKELITVSDGTRLKYVRNVAALKRHLSASGQERDAVFAEAPKKQKVSSTPKAKGDKAGGEPLRRERKTRLNFKVDDPDEVVLEKLRNHKIVWKSRVSGEYDEDVIGQDRNPAKHYKIVDFDDNRQVHFVGAFGFRAVYLNQIVSVR